ncbi:MAG TPA: DUF6600 domain-containing protein [Polyangiaceae bacterium]|nr:DUF6600 domain-containing protein [Polyangiaceae bacterium]
MSVLTRSTTVRVISTLFAAAFAAVTAPARAEGPGPAYLIEPGEQPPNSVQMEQSASPPDVAPEATAPEEQNAYEGYEATIPPEAAAAVPAEPAPEAPTAAASDEDPRALSEFSPRLDPYGSWTNDPNYGQVWTPDSSIVGDGFSPYLTDGHWTVDSSGSQVWNSDYPFGDIVFHYGRWVWITSGWAWIPGYRYAPAWVAWRLPTDGLGYYGWAPLPPSFVWMNRSAVGLPWRSSYYWVFCPSDFVHSAAPASYVVRSPAEAQNIAAHTRAYVPASPRRTPAAGAIAQSGAPRQNFAPGYRPVMSGRARVVAAAPTTANASVAPHMTAAVSRPRPAAVRPPPGATMMHAATPVRAPVAAPRITNTPPPRVYPAAFRGGVIRR